MVALAAALLLASEPNPDAVRLTRKATVEYNAGEFGQAFLDYQSAYDLEPVPELLFDMGQCQRELHHWERADFLYKRYLTAKPKARNRVKVEALMEKVEQQDHKEPRAPAEAAAPAPTPAAAPSEPAATATPAAEPPAAAAAPHVEPPAETPVEPPAAESFGLVAPPKVVKPEPEPSHSHGLPAATWIAGATGAACLLGAGALGIVVLAQPDAVTYPGNSTTPTHSLTYSQLSTINAEGSVSVGLAIGGAVLLGAAALFAVVAQ